MSKAISNALDFLSGSNKKVEEVKEDVVEKVETSEQEQKEVLSNTETKTEEVVEETNTETISEQPSFTDEMFFKRASEMLDREILKPDDLVLREEVVKEIEVPKEKEYISDFSKGYDKYFKETNRSAKDYLMLQRDIDTMGQEDVIKETLKTENPNLTKSQLNRLYDRKYKIDADEMTEIEIEDAKLDFEIAYQKGKNFLVKQKETYIIPKDNSIASVERNTNEQKEQIEKANALWTETVNKENQNLTGLEIDLGEDFKFTHAISDEERSQVKDIASDASLQKFYQRYQNNDGTYDAKKYQKDLYILDHINEVLQDVREHAKATQLEEDIKEEKNINFKSDVKPQLKKKYSKEAEQSLDILRKKYKLKN